MAIGLHHLRLTGPVRPHTLLLVLVLVPLALVLVLVLVLVVLVLVVPQVPHAVIITQTIT